MDRSGRIRSLDGLRAVSVTMVIVAHLTRHTALPARFDLGNLGVRVFFVLSGFPTVVDALAAGCALALARDALWRWPPYRRFLGSPAFVVVPLVAVAAHAGGKHPLFSFLIGASLVNAAIALSVDRVVRFPDGPIGRFLDRRPVVLVGVASYSIYLWQQPFLDVRSNAWWTAFPQNLLLVAVCAAASYHLIERPFLRLRFSLETRRAPRKARPARQAA
ncbi:acyltransferase family protein [Sorangium sp. So ce118]